MQPLVVPFLATCLLLLLAGAAKLWRPGGTAQTLQTQGLPSVTGLVRVLGAAEVALAVAALAQVPGAAAGVGGAYAAFTGFVLVVLLRDRPLRSCGCFGQPDLPATPLHAVVTALAAGCAVTVAVDGGARLGALRAVDPPTAVATVGGAALLGWLAYLVLDALPRLLATRDLRVVRPAAPSPRSAAP